MKALALIEAPNHVCSRYRLLPFLPALETHGCTVTVEPIARHPARRLAQFASARHHDVVFLQRRLLPGWQLHWLRRHARRLLFDLDDAVLYRDSYDPRGPNCPRRRRRFNRTVRLADQILAGNDFLAGLVLQAGAQPHAVQVIPTCVETAHYATTRPHLDRPGLELVWIGSGSTLQGLVQVRSLIERLGREVPGLRLRLICDRSAQFDGVQVIHSPWSEQTETEDLAQGDVGISWVPDDLWSRGKCGLKLLQYHAAGLPALTNPVGVHDQIVQEHRTGLLARTADEWIAATRMLAEHPDVRRQMGAHARQHVQAHYSVAAWLDRFVAVFTNTRRVIPEPRFQRHATRVPRTWDRSSLPPSRLSAED